MAAFKGVKFAYQATSLTRDLLITFRDMVNDAIRICLGENVRGRLKLRDRIHKEFQERYGLVSCFAYSVAEVAWSIVRKHKRWHRKPFARRLMFKVEASKFSIKSSILSLPYKKGQRILLPLRRGNYQGSFLQNETKRGAVTVTESSVIIAFSKNIPLLEPSCKVGYDLNEKSIVGSDGTRHDLSEVGRLHTLYGIRRSKFHKRHARDRRLVKKFASSRREKERVNQLLHRVSTLIVKKAIANGEAIVLERLKGIRYAHEKGKREGKARRRRLAQWPFRQLQDYIEYKAGWVGVQVEYVSPSYTSKICNICGSINRTLGIGERSWLCPCGAKLDRDLNAAINIQRRGKIRCLGEGCPGARGKDEAMRGNETTMAPILRAEALKSIGGVASPPAGKNPNAFNLPVARGGWKLACRY